MNKRCKQVGRERPTTAGSGRRSGGLPVLLVSTFLAFINYAALLPVVPMWTAQGGAASVAVGGTTGAMMAATVATQFAMPSLFKLISLRAMMILGALLLGAPTPLYALSTEIVPVVLITVIRGIGFAFVVTAGATLTADIAGPGKLSSSASYYGVAAALPNLGALAGGVWVADAWGYPIVFASAGTASLAGAIVAWKLPGRSRGHFQLASMKDVRRITAPIVLFLLVASSFGAATTFLPLSGPDAETAALALLAASVALVVVRLVAGVVGDRYGAGRLLSTSVLSGVLGCLLIAVSLDGPAWLLLLGASMLGAGFGACQNDSFVVTIQRLGEGRSGTASTIWNIAYDGGLGLGAVCFGWIVGQLGYGSSFIALAAGIAVVTLISLPRIRIAAAPH